MSFRAIAGLVAGMCAGVVSGVMYLVMTLPDADGFTVPLLTVVSRALGYNDPSMGWSFHIFNACVAGILFGLLFGRLAVSLSRALAAGLVLGLFWWVISAVIVLPVLVSQQTFFSAHFMTSAHHPILVGTLLGSLVYGILLGAIYLFIYGPVYDEEVLWLQRERERRRMEQEELARAS